MKKVLRISNDGLIEKEDLFLIGSSTKRNETNKIGMFGSGWKYALAYLMRNDLNVKIFSGHEEIEVGTEIVLHRNTPTKVITIDGEKTSLTTSMGPKWNGWMAIRELVSNAIDEGGFDLETLINPSDNYYKEENKTFIYLEINNEINECIMNFENYFSFERKHSLKNDQGRIFIKKEETNCNVYRKGIRCYKEYRDSFLDFDLNKIEINESRLVDSEHALDVTIRKLIQNNITFEVAEAALKGKYKDYLPYKPNQEWLEYCKLIVDSGKGFITEKLTTVKHLLDFPTECYKVTSSWFESLIEHGIIDNPFENSIEQGMDFIECHNHTINEYDIRKYLAKINLGEISMKFGIFGNRTSTIGYGNNTCYLHSENCKDKNPKYIASVILKNLPDDKIMNEVFV